MSARSNPSGQWLDLAAAAVPAVAAAWSSALLAPLADIPAGVASPAAGLAMFLAGWGLMRRAAPPAAVFAVVPFRLPAGPGEFWPESEPESEPAAGGEDDILVLDQPLEELVLDDPLPAPGAQSRVVQLFPAQPLLATGPMERRIDPAGHTPTGGPAEANAADSLRRALDELRRTLARR